MAVEDSGLNMESEDPSRLGIVLGNGCGGFPDIEDGGRTVETRGGMRLSPFFFPMILPNMATSQVSRVLGLKGFTNTVTTACAAGTQGVWRRPRGAQAGLGGRDGGRRHGWRGSASWGSGGSA